MSSPIPPPRNLVPPPRPNVNTSKISTSANASPTSTAQPYHHKSSSLSGNRTPSSHSQVTLNDELRGLNLHTSETSSPLSARSFKDLDSRHPVKTLSRADSSPGFSMTRSASSNNIHQESNQLHSSPSLKLHSNVTESMIPLEPPTRTTLKGVLNNFVSSMSGTPLKKSFLLLMILLNPDLLSPDKKLEISTPYNPVHLTHVGFNADTGEFTVSFKILTKYLQLILSLG